MCCFLSSTSIVLNERATSLAWIFSFSDWAREWASLLILARASSRSDAMPRSSSSILGVAVPPMGRHFRPPLLPLCAATTKEVLVDVASERLVTEVPVTEDGDVDDVIDEDDSGSTVVDTEASGGGAAAIGTGS